MAIGNTQPASARVVTLGDRKDGNAAARETIRLLVGEIAPVWIETKLYCGGVWLDSADSAAVEPAAELLVSNVTVQETKVELWLDATLAIAGQSYSVTCDVHPDADQTIKAEFDVEIVAT